jgi:hypothetical protein
MRRRRVVHGVLLLGLVVLVAWVLIVIEALRVPHL